MQPQLLRYYDKLRIFQYWQHNVYNLISYDTFYEECYDLRTYCPKKYWGWWGNSVRICKTTKSSAAIFFLSPSQLTPLTGWHVYRSCNTPYYLKISNFKIGTEYLDFLVDSNTIAVLPSSKLNLSIFLN